ncbi:TRAP transporter large permease [uncultured Oscillibacter sp.]|uniref:TRAP transporter large permease n=1 Tax=uncultured Oscillibacter sp. TaxID=876091 RepID=UPI002602CFEA|nr:TRAP transporter large permease [uncultured Oscillibacter sp.]
MSSSALITVLVVLFGLLLIGSPVVMAIGTAAMSYFLIKPDMLGNLMMYAHRLFTGMDSFIYICIPLFMLSGELMGYTGLMDRVVDFCRIFVGRLRGGVAYVNVLSSMLFGGISGSALADIAALGPIEISLMESDGYDREFSAALTATSAIQGPIIPPSIPAVMFASLTSVSVGALFIGGLVPGIMLGLAQISVIAYLARKHQFPKSDVCYTLKEGVLITLKSLSALFMIVLILGGILSGTFTATEASAVSIIYVLVIDICFYHTLTPAKIWEALKKTAVSSASIFLIIGFTSIISWILAMENVPVMISNWVYGANISPYLLLFIVNVFFLFNGMWISDSAQLVLFAPIFTPIFTAMGVSAVHFGVVMVVNVMIGLITPPFGVGLYTAASVSGCELKRIVKASLPFTAACVTVLFLITYIPGFALTLPRLVGYTI